MRRYPVANLGQRIPPAFEVAIDRLFDKFAGQWGIIGVGDSYPQGQLVIEVLTKEDPEIAAAMLPSEFMGFPVRVIYSGEIVLQEQERSSSGSILKAGERVGATGGQVEKQVGFLWFFPDTRIRANYEAITGKPSPESVGIEVTFCNPTPGTFPVVADFIDPETNLYCFTDMAEKDVWQEAWRM